MRAGSATLRSRLHARGAARRAAAPRARARRRASPRRGGWPGGRSARSPRSGACPGRAPPPRADRAGRVHPGLERNGGCGASAPGVGWAATPVPPGRCVPLTGDAQVLAPRGRTGADEGDPWRIREPEDAVDRPGARCRGRRRPGLPGRASSPPCERETGWDPRQAAIIVGTSAGSVTGAALRVGVPATDLAASLYGVPTSRRGGAILRRILPADAEPLPTPSVGSLLSPLEPAVPRAHHPDRPPPPGLPARGGGR